MAEESSFEDLTPPRTNENGKTRSAEIVEKVATTAIAGAEILAGDPVVMAELAHAADVRKIDEVRTAINALPSNPVEDVAKETVAHLAEDRSPAQQQNNEKKAA